MIGRYGMGVSRRSNPDVLRRKKSGRRPGFFDSLGMATFPRMEMWHERDPIRETERHETIRGPSKERNPAVAADSCGDGTNIPRAPLLARGNLALSASPSPACGRGAGPKGRERENGAKRSRQTFRLHFN